MVTADVTPDEMEALRQLVRERAEANRVAAAAAAREEEARKKTALAKGCGAKTRNGKAVRV